MKVVVDHESVTSKGVVGQKSLPLSFLPAVHHEVKQICSTTCSCHDVLPIRTRSMSVPSHGQKLQDL